MKFLLWIFLLLLTVFLPTSLVITTKLITTVYHCGEVPLWLKIWEVLGLYSFFFFPFHAIGLLYLLNKWQQEEIKL